MIFFAKFLIPSATKKLQKKVDDFKRNNPRAVKIALGRTAEFLLGRIRNRTQKGKDADEIPFKPYTSQYKEFRREKGRQVRFPDLNFSGQMLSNMTQKSNTKNATLFFASKFQNAKAVGNQKKRKFFLIGNREQKTLINFFAKELFKINKL
jgi:hypothetical protein